MGLILIHVHGPTAFRKKRRATAAPSTAHANSAKAGANPATGLEGLYMCCCYMYMYMYRCIITAPVSWQSTEIKEGEMVHLQRQLQETRTENNQLNSKCFNRLCTKSTKWWGSCFADELVMVKKISSAKDLELDERQIKLKAFEGEFMCACING